MKKILVVDDSPFAAHVINDILRRTYDVFHSIDSISAIEYLKKNKPDLILLDIVMPGMDGIEAFKKLQSKDCTKDIPVIFITSAYNDVIESACLELGAADFVRKPVNGAVLLLRIKKVIGT